MKIEAAHTAKISPTQPISTQCQYSRTESTSTVNHHKSFTSGSQFWTEYLNLSSQVGSSMHVAPNQPCIEAKNMWHNIFMLLCAFILYFILCCQYLRLHSDKLVAWLVNWKAFWRKQTWCKDWKDWEKPWIWNRIASPPAEIQTRHPATYKSIALPLYQPATSWLHGMVLRQGGIFTFNCIILPLLLKSNNFQVQTDGKQTVTKVGGIWKTKHTYIIT